MPNGKPYENTESCWASLCFGGRDARFLGLIPHEEIVDRKNKETIVGTRAEREDADIRVYGMYDYDITFPDPPWLALRRPTIPQKYHIAMVVEKTTIDGIIEPFANSMELTCIVAAARSA